MALRLRLQAQAAVRRLSSKMGERRSLQAARVICGTYCESLEVRLTGRSVVISYIHS